LKTNQLLHSPEGKQASLIIFRASETKVAPFRRNGRRDPDTLPIQPLPAWADAFLSRQEEISIERHIKKKCVKINYQKIL
jgi:hypothetical protein